jgi:hypothetical protein
MLNLKIIKRSISDSVLCVILDSDNTRKLILVIKQKFSESKTGDLMDKLKDIKYDKCFLCKKRICSKFFFFFFFFFFVIICSKF